MTPVLSCLRLHVVAILAAAMTVQGLTLSDSTAQEDAYRVVPRQRTGRFLLGRSIDAYELGPPTGVWGGASEGRVYYDGHAFHAAAGRPALQMYACRSDGLVFAVLVIRRLDVPLRADAEELKYKTGEGVAIGTDEGDVIRLLGRPESTSEWTERHGTVTVRAVAYNYPGLRVMANRVDQKVYALGAVAPGGWSGCLQAVLRRPPAPPAAQGIAGEGAHIEPKLRGRTDVLFFGGYESSPWWSAWGVTGVGRPENLEIISDAAAYQGKSLRVRYPRGSHGGNPANLGGTQYHASFGRLGLPFFDELYLRYYVRLDPGFDFVQGGKLPGPAGGASNSGGRIPTGSDGFSVRLMWRREGRIVIYAYLPTSQTWGTDFPWDYGGTWRKLIPGRWTALEIRVKLNTPGRSDGEIDCWLDGERACEVRNLRFRDVDSLKIDNIMFSTFFGGNTADWAPSKDEYATFDNFVLGGKYVGP